MCFFVKNVGFESDMALGNTIQLSCFQSHPTKQSGSAGRAGEWVRIKCQRADQAGIMFLLGPLFLSDWGRLHEVMEAGRCC